MHVCMMLRWCSLLRCVQSDERGQRKNLFACRAQQNLLNTFEYILLLLGKRTSVISHCCFLLQLGPSIKTKTAGSSFIHYARRTHKKCGGETSAVRAEIRTSREILTGASALRFLIYARRASGIKFNGSFNLSVCRVPRVIWFIVGKSKQTAPV
jgi:hypothetical protein